MKKFKILAWTSPLMLTGFLLLFLFSCKKDSSSNSSSSSTTTTIPATVTDYDGNVYHTIKIGTQAWLVENLKVTHYRNGTAISNATTASAWTSLASGGGYCDYLFMSAEAAKYGHLYNWAAVTSSNNIAPTGWHVATNAEYSTLISYLGGASAAGGTLKETGTADWYPVNVGATNSSGFTALPGGYIDGTGASSLITNYGCFWTTTSISSSSAYDFETYYGNASASQNARPIGCGMSVRCVMN